MFLESFPFVILNDAMAFLYAYFFGGGGGGSHKHSLLSVFSLDLKQFAQLYTTLES